ncbi:MAG: M36 family metallopeptidase [Oligoflexia bacterium]|nr:M36 family metallopeptidase [Oligoflexia bacterium]
MVRTVRVVSTVSIDSVVNMAKIFIYCAVLTSSFFLKNNQAIAQIQEVRWTYEDGGNGDSGSGSGSGEDAVAVLRLSINKINQILKLDDSNNVAMKKHKFMTDDFVLIEDRVLSGYHFFLFLQSKQGVPLLGHTLRIWTAHVNPSFKNGDLVQLEGHLDPQVLSESTRSAGSGISALSMSIRKILSHKREIFDSRETIRVAMNFLESKASKDLRVIKNIKWEDYWHNGLLVRRVVVSVKLGKYIIEIDINSRKVVNYTYRPHSSADIGNIGGNTGVSVSGPGSISSSNYFSIPARVYPIYEEPEKEVGRILPRIDSELRFLKTKVRVSGESYGEGRVGPYDSLRQHHYLSSKYSPLLAETSIGHTQGLWSLKTLNQDAADIYQKYPLRSNGVDGNSTILLEGAYASINIHPQAKEYFEQLSFIPQFSSSFRTGWKKVDVGDGVGEGESVGNTSEYELIADSAFWGYPLQNRDDAYLRPARRDPENNPLSYIRDGFDEVQVYWAITTFFESLIKMGFSDPELSARPFSAFLFDPDVETKNNAYYTDDTINFGTYSSSSQNYARDNTTVWHELGHGITDRIMGEHLNLSGTEGLSEGLADFLAQVILMDTFGEGTFPGDKDFRIVNQMDFNYCNEVHDGGEAFGGAMLDILHDVMTNTRVAARKEGIKNFVALTLESMRLTRNHPALDESNWFRHMLFVDRIHGGKLSQIIVKRLAARNLSLNQESDSAAIKVMVDNSRQLEFKGEGSREEPILHRLSVGEVARHQLSISLSDGNLFKFQYPITLKVQYNGGPLQGAIHWKDEETKSNNDRNNKNDNNQRLYHFNGPTEKVNLDLVANDKCDYINTNDGGCVDFVYLLFFRGKAGDPTRAIDSKPFAKKRFYLKVSQAI